jgi:4-diphosphocytidyl-2-C-methyl-D-erythritol kinase
MIRTATIKSPAKLNLDLRVLYKRPDGFHELRTVFQTISLADTIKIEFQPARNTTLEIDATDHAGAGIEGLNTADNLILRAAQAVLDTAKTHAKVRFALNKIIPMGGGLGGGSTNAAAVLLALPVLLGKYLPLEKLMELGATLGSDVPFFLTGGTALAADRGTELYAIPDIAREPILIVASGIHVATGPAYKALARPFFADLYSAENATSTGHLTLSAMSRNLNSFQSFVRVLGDTGSAKAASAYSANDFEPVVFAQHPQLQSLFRRLCAVTQSVETSALESRVAPDGKRVAQGRRSRAGQGSPACRMTGSGSTLFAVFGSLNERNAAIEKLKTGKEFAGSRLLPANLVSRRSYQGMWRKQLAGHILPPTGLSSARVNEQLWPPRSRYER